MQKAPLSSSELNLRSNHNINKAIFIIYLLMKFDHKSKQVSPLPFSIFDTGRGFSATPSSSQERCCYSREICSRAGQASDGSGGRRPVGNKQQNATAWRIRCISETKCKILFAVLLILIIVISLPRMNPERRDDVMQSRDSGRGDGGDAGGVAEHVAVTVGVETDLQCDGW